MRTLCGPTRRLAGLAAARDEFDAPGWWSELCAAVRAADAKNLEAARGRCVDALL